MPEKRTMTILSLEHIPLKRKFKILASEGDMATKNKLKSIGIAIGMEVMVIKRHKNTPSIIEVDRAKIAVGKKVLQAIRVE